MPFPDRSSAPSQVASHVVMICPANFAPNAQTAASNAYQASRAGAPAELGGRARAEVEAVARQLGDAGVGVSLFEDSPAVPKPDAVFPNNWLSMHADGQVVLYPLHAGNRRPERRMDVIDTLGSAGFRVREIVDLTYLEADGVALEGTGSLVFDHPAHHAFAALSVRTHAPALSVFADRLGYRITSFSTEDAGRPVYHTNVMLAIGRHFAAICDEAIVDPEERLMVLQELRDSGRELLRLDREQMRNFAANLIELETPGGPLIALSARALASLTPAQRRSLEAHGRLVAPAIETIETGGGSLRCMLAEVFLPRRPGADS